MAEDNVKKTIEATIVQQQHKAGCNQSSRFQEYSKQELRSVILAFQVQVSLTSLHSCH